VRLLVIGALSVCAVAFADQAEDRAKLVGTWRASAGATAWTIEQDAGELHVIRSENDRKVADYRCNTSGRECKIEDEGKPATVSLWFNGPALVELETRGNDIVKRRFSMGAGDDLKVEVTPITGGWKAETIELKRVEVAAGRK
jgi:hypothetical protein